MLKLLISLAFIASVAHGLSLPNSCMYTMCTMDLKICPNGKPAPIAPGDCCPSLRACFPDNLLSRSNPLLGSVLSNGNLLNTLVGATHGTDLGTVISILNLLNNIQQVSNDIHQIPLLINQTLSTLVAGAGEAGQIIINQLVGAVNTMAPQSTSRDLLSLLGQNTNLLSGISSILPPGTSIATVLSVLKLLSSINALTNDVHQIPVLLNQTLATVVDGAGQAGQIIIDQLLGLVGLHSQPAGRDLLSLLGQNTNLLSGISSILPPGTSIATVLSVLKLLSSINALTNDVHQIPVLLNQTLATVVDGAGQAGQIIIDQLLGLVGLHSQPAGRDLLSLLGQNTNLLSGISSILPPGTSFATVLSVLKLLSNINALSNDVHQIPVLLNQTLATVVDGAGQAGQIIIDQLLGLVGLHSQPTGRDLLGTLGQNAILLSTLSHLLPQGTSIATVISLLNLLSNVNALNNDIHQIPILLQDTLQSFLSGVQNLLPTNTK